MQQSPTQPCDGFKVNFRELLNIISVSNVCSHCCLQQTKLAAMIPYELSEELYIYEMLRHEGVIISE